MKKPKYTCGQDVWYKVEHNGRIHISKGTISSVFYGSTFVDYTLSNGVFISESCVFHSSTMLIIADLLQVRLKQAEANYAIKCLTEKLKVNNWV